MIGGSTGTEQGRQQVRQPRKPTPVCVVPVGTVDPGPIPHRLLGTQRVSLDRGAC